jgi:hypothetical protein
MLKNTVRSFTKLSPARELRILQRKLHRERRLLQRAIALTNRVARTGALRREDA